MLYEMREAHFLSKFIPGTSFNHEPTVTDGTFRTREMNNSNAVLQRELRYV